MDKTNNPYTPGAGTQPPEFAGRDDIIQEARIAFKRTILHYSEQGIIFTGLRGVGKTVLLAHIKRDAEDAGIQTVFIESLEDRPLPALLATTLRGALYNMSSISSKLSEGVKYALATLKGFAQTWKVNIGDISFEPILGIADNKDLEQDLQALMEIVGKAAKDENKAVILIIDELQYVKETELAALCSAMHRTAQSGLPVLFFGAGLPNLPGKFGKAKSYAERLFRFIEIGSLPNNAATDAIAKPAKAAGVDFTSDALSAIVSGAQGYPYFLQEWGKQVWNTAAKSPINAADVKTAESLIYKQLDESFFRVRFDRLTPAEKIYLRAIADLPQTPCRSSDIGEKILNKKNTSLGPRRAQLINKGMIYSPAHGEIDFTVPLFSDFLRRKMPPDSAWQEEN